MSAIQAQSICLYMHQTLDQTDSGLGFARIVVSEIEAPSILVIRSEFIVNLARRGRTAVQNDNSTEPYRHPLDAAWLFGGQEGAVAGPNAGFGHAAVGSQRLRV
jgi:hypothetical protein